jgi:hypothetical protein
MTIDMHVNPHSEAESLDQRLKQVDEANAASIDRDNVNRRRDAARNKFNSFLEQARAIHTTGAGFRTQQFGQRLETLLERASRLDDNNDLWAEDSFHNSILGVHAQFTEMSLLVQSLHTCVWNLLLQMVNALNFPGAPPVPKAWPTTTRDVLALLLGAVHPPFYAIILAYNGVSKIVEMHLMSRDNRKAKEALKSVVIAEWYLSLAEKTALKQIANGLEAVVNAADRFDPLFGRLEAILAECARREAVQEGNETTTGETNGGTVNP